jgi:hypothetical protein
MMRLNQQREVQTMSERALAFVESWVVEKAAAQAEGIPKAEIDEAIDDLPAFMAGQIKESVDREGGGKGSELIDSACRTPAQPATGGPDGSRL